MKKKTTGWILGLLACVLLAAGSFRAEAAVRLNKTAVTLAVGKTCKLKVKGTDSSVLWTSRKPSVAKVSEDGIVTAVKKGSAKITATADGKKLTCAVTVIEDQSKLKLKKSKKTYNVKLYVMDPKYSEELTPNTKRDSRRFPEKITLDTSAVGKLISARSSNSSVCAVSKKGVLTTSKKQSWWYWKTLSLGTATVTARTKSGTFRIKVEVQDYAHAFADYTLSAVARKIAKQYPGKNEATLRAITAYVAENYDYGHVGSNYVLMTVKEAGDCWGSVSMICELCRYCGIQAEERLNPKSNSKNHKDAVATLADGTKYVLEAGHNAPKPRKWEVELLETE